MYNQASQSTGACMPLIMGYTQPEKIREAESDEPVVFYDPKTQITVVKPFVMRVVGTYSLKTTQTKIGNGNRKFDKKNEIDDQKNVK